MKPNEYVTVRFDTGNGCILCGRDAVWRVKTLDNKNRPYMICLDCLTGLRELRTENVRKEKDTGKGSGDSKPTNSIKQSKGKEQFAGKEPSHNVEGNPASG